MASPLILTLATHNEGKRRELLHWAESGGWPVTLATYPHAPEVDETGATFLENARLKASQSPAVSGSAYVLAEDSGLVVDALAGRYDLDPFPGIYSNRWLTAERRDALVGRSFPNERPLDRTAPDGVTNSDLCQALLTLMQGQSHRTARYCCGMALWQVGQGLCFETLQSTELTILHGPPRGQGGFGYDPVTLPVSQEDFIADGRTMAELSLPEKNRISHRGRAFRQVLGFLAAQMSK